jgi:hypothetical protein
MAQYASADGRGKQGGLACQQADVAAAHIAVRAGADVEVPPLQQVLRGRLLTGTHDRFLRAAPAGPRRDAPDQPLLWASAKVGGEHLSAYLIAKDAVDLPVRDGPAALDIDIGVRAHA